MKIDRSSVILGVTIIVIILTGSVSFLTFTKKITTRIQRLEQKVAERTETPSSVNSKPSSKENANIEEIRTEFPMFLLHKTQVVQDTWIPSKLLETVPGCITNPTESVGEEIISPACKVWKEGFIDSGANVAGAILPHNIQKKEGILQILKNGKAISLPPLLVNGGESISISYLNETDILATIHGYEYRESFRLSKNRWALVSVPNSVLEAYPWSEKPPFRLVLGKKYDKYIETRWPPSGDGYFGDDPYRDRYALFFIVDRTTNAVVDVGAIERE